MKQTLLPFIAAAALMGASGTAQAETWECSIMGATQKVILIQESDPEQTLSLPCFKSFPHNEDPHWLFVGIEKPISLIELDSLQFPDLVAQMAGRKSDGCRVILYRSSADYEAA